VRVDSKRASDQDALFFILVRKYNVSLYAFLKVPPRHHGPCHPWRCANLEHPCSSHAAGTFDLPWSAHKGNWGRSCALEPACFLQIDKNSLLPTNLQKDN